MDGGQGAGYASIAWPWIMSLGYRRAKKICLGGFVWDVLVKHCLFTMKEWSGLLTSFVASLLLLWRTLIPVFSETSFE
jgi:hypothetical protein